MAISSCGTGFSDGLPGVPPAQALKRDGADRALARARSGLDAHSFQNERGPGPSEDPLRQVPEGRGCRHRGPGTQASSDVTNKNAHFRNRLSTVVRSVLPSPAAGGGDHGVIGTTYVIWTGGSEETQDGSEETRGER